MTHASVSLSSPKAGLSSTVITANLREQAEEILRKRGLNIELISRLGWRSSAKNTFGEEEIEIPYFRGELEVNCKTRTISGEKKFRQVKGGTKCFYNESAITDWQKSNDAILITEGEMDCIVALQCGYLAISVPDGAPSQEVGEDSIKYGYLDGFPKLGTVIICSDGDQAGANLLHDLSTRLGKGRCKWIKYPKGCKDLNEVFLAYGERGVSETIKRAEWLKVDGVFKMGELPPLPEQLGQKCSFLPITIRKGDFSVITGIPSHGKSTLTNAIAHDMAIQGWRVGFASFEQRPQTHHRHNLRSLILGMKPSQAHPDELAHADGWIDERYSFIVPDVDSDDDASLGWLLEKMAAAYTRHEVDMFVIDPWNEMDHDFDNRQMTETKYVGFAIRQLKKFAYRYQVHVMVIAHPTKLKPEKKGKIGCPNLYDIEGSAHWYNKPDLGGVVHLQDGDTMFWCQKSRYHEYIGKPGKYFLSFDDETKKFKPSVADYSA